MKSFLSLFLALSILACLIPSGELFADRGGEQAKEQHIRRVTRVTKIFSFVKGKDGRAVLVSQQTGRSEIKGDGVNLETLAKRANNFENNVGNFTLLGAVGNTGVNAAGELVVTGNFKDSGNNTVGSYGAEVRGGSNVKLDDNSFTNALLPGDTGYYRMDTPFDFEKIISWDLAYTYTPKNATQYTRTTDPVFASGPTFSSSGGKLQVSGGVTNPGSSLTYWNDIYFFIFDSSGKLVDVKSTYVMGSEYNYGGGTTDTALQPGASGTFSRTFYETGYSSYSSYDSAFQYYVADGGGGTEEKNPPFGSFDTPLDQSTVRSSIPVTGWALDDSEVSHVKIWRQSSGGLVYIGDANFVEGARPDVQQSYPDYPNNSRAGWGYMMLTNFLPGGDGTFTLEAIATDSAGKSTSLGTRTIHVDNDNAVKPFGAIDTPLQGGTAAGSGYINWGWALTPQPKKIPEDGSTIDVYVDGVNRGNPSYNLYREDIATLFPGYANTNGAVGYFYLDTTAYADGVHTIQWTATDNEGSTDGIGSRYFTIQNPRIANRTASGFLPHIADIMALPIDETAAISFREGFDDSVEMKRAAKHLEGTANISMPQSRRLVIRLNDRREDIVSYDGYLLMNGQLSGLPVGSTLNRSSGTFYWMPGPAFRGRFPLVFVKTGANGQRTRSMVLVDIQQ